MFRLNVRDYGAIGNGVIDDTSAFERALVDLYERYPDPSYPYSGELFIPNGIYRLTRGIRGPASYPVQVSCLRPQREDAPPNESPNIFVAGPDTNHGRFRLEIERGGGLGVATFRWSQNWGRTWETGITIPAGGSYTLGTAERGIVVTFPAGVYWPMTEYFWPGNGAHPLPPHCRIVGEHMVKTVLSFNFSRSEGRGDGIRMVWNAVQQSGRFVAIRDLTLENTSASNRLDHDTIRSEGTAPPLITLAGHPYRDDFEFKVEITREGGLGTATFRYSTDDGRTWLRVDWANPDSVDVVVRASVQLVGSGMTVHFPDAHYSTDNVYTWNVTGYAGAGILCTGENEVTIERVSVRGFARSVILDGTLNSRISHCILFPQDRNGNDVVGSDATIAIWLTRDYYHPSASFLGATGLANIHLIENCKLGGPAISIWHEDGVLHTVRQCDFTSAQVCALFGSPKCVRYENCYTENISPTGGGAFFEMSRGGIAHEVEITNCWLGNQHGAPLFRLTAGQISRLTFSGNLAQGGLESPLFVGAGNIQASFWNSSVVAPNLLDYPDVKYDTDGQQVFLSGKNSEGIGLGTFKPTANLHLRQWVDPLLPLFRFENGGNPLLRKRYELSGDLSTLSHQAGIGSDAVTPHGIYQAVKIAFTRPPRVPDDPTDVDAFEWPMLGEVYVHAEATFLLTTDGGGVCAFWKLRVLAQKVGGVITIVGERATTLDSSVPAHLPRIEFSVPTIEPAGNDRLLFRAHQGTIPWTCTWTVKVEITQGARGGF